MSSGLSKMNLRPQERRFVAFVVIVVFVVLNIWLVWPHFGDWGLITSRRERAEKTLASYQAEQGKTKAYQVRLRELESSGSSVIPDEQELDLVRTVDNQARVNRLNVIQLDPRPRTSMTAQTNRFFEEQYVTLHATCDNEELVNFLGSLASTNSLIRVKDLSLKVADVGATRLDGNMTLVASYQRRAPARTSTQPATSAAPPPVSTPAAARPAARTNKPSATVPASAATNKPALSRTRLTNQPAKKP
jgi:hypothetical protein